MSGALIGRLGVKDIFKKITVGAFKVFKCFVPIFLFNLKNHNEDETQYSENVLPHNQCSTFCFQDTLGNTALHYAVQFSDDDVVFELLKHGSGWVYVNKRGETPLSKMALDTFLKFLDFQVTEEKKSGLIHFNLSFLAPPKYRNFLTSQVSFF